MEEGNIFAFFMSCSWLCYAWRKETYLPFPCLVPDFVTLGGRKHICLFHALLLAFWRFEQGNIFAFFIPCSWLCYAWRKETYLPFSCLVPHFLTLWARKHISLFHAPERSIFPLVKYQPDPLSCGRKCAPKSRTQWVKPRVSPSDWLPARSSIDSSRRAKITL